MEESSVSGYGEEVQTKMKVMHVVDNPCHLVVQAVRAIVKCFGFHESASQRNQEEMSSAYSLPEDKQRNQTSPENETPVVEERLRFMRRVPAPPMSRGGGGQIN